MFQLTRIQRVLQLSKAVSHYQKTSAPTWSSINCLLNTNCCLESLSQRTIHTTRPTWHFLDARDKDHEDKEKRLIMKESLAFDEIARKTRNKETFHKAVQKYNKRNDKYKRGHVEFIYAAMDKLVEFQVHKDIQSYKLLLDIFPKGKMISETMWQAESMHYPKQQQCAIDLLDEMESHGVTPDDAMGAQLIKIFGQKAIVFRKYQRMMYWMPKFKHANPYPVPFILPEDMTELAVLALKRMAPDRKTKVTVFQSSDLESFGDDTFIASAQSPDQMELSSQIPADKPVFVEGGFTVWLRQKSLHYFILRSDITPRAAKFKEELFVKEDDENLFEWSNMFEGEEPPKDLVVKPTVHEQEDGTILAMCITGTGSKDSLISWINFLQDTNPKLKEVPILFTLRTPDEGIPKLLEESNNKHDGEMSVVT